MSIHSSHCGITGSEAPTGDKTGRSKGPSIHPLLLLKDLGEELAWLTYQNQIVFCYL
jgi:hypothetical protein